MRLPRSTAFWASCFVAWFCLLWFLSGRPAPEIDGPQIPFADKVAHFGYFFGGSGLFCAALFRKAKGHPNWKKLTWTTIIVVTAIGALDEFHQSFTPERFGNDPFDLFADCLGAIAGTQVFRKMSGLLK